MYSIQMREEKTKVGVHDHAATMRTSWTHRRCSVTAEVPVCLRETEMSMPSGLTRSNTYISHIHTHIHTQTLSLKKTAVNEYWTSA